MSTPGQGLEHLVTRIHKLLEPAQAKVIWNKRVQDPDTGRLRQVDIMIERDGKQTHIECRDQERPQGIAWIEELIGRRASLRADAVIGVSSSGFTATAMSKAKKFGIFVRDFRELADHEIEQWGCTSRFEIEFIRFSDLGITALVSPEGLRRISSHPKLSLREDPTDPVLLIVNALINKASDSFRTNQYTTIRAKLVQPNLLADGFPIETTEITLRGHLVEKRVDLVTVSAYRDSTPLSPRPRAVVERHEMGETKVIRSPTAASVILDVTQVAVPRNHYLHTVKIDFGHDIDADFEIIGWNQELNIKLDLN